MGGRCSRRHTQKNFAQPDFATDRDDTLSEWLVVQTATGHLWRKLFNNVVSLLMQRQVWSHMGKLQKPTHAASQPAVLS